MRDDTGHTHQEYLASIHYYRYVRWSACGHQGIEFGGKYSQTLHAVKRHSVHLVKKTSIPPWASLRTSMFVLRGRRCSVWVCEVTPDTIGLRLILQSSLDHDRTEQPMCLAPGYLGSCSLAILAALSDVHVL